MVIYYSKTGNTRIFAEELAKLLGMELFELKEERPNKGFFGNLRGAWGAIRKKESKVAALPKLSGAKKIFLCTPVWVGGIPPATRYFMNHAALKGVEVNVLTTCMDTASRQKYADNALDAFAAAAKDCVKGAAYGFVTIGRKAAVDRETVREHMEAMIPGK